MSVNVYGESSNKPFTPYLEKSRSSEDSSEITNQEAIKILLEMRDNLSKETNKEQFINQYEALTKAIKALEE